MALLAGLVFMALACSDAREDVVAAERVASYR